MAVTLTLEHVRDAVETDLPDTALLRVLAVAKAQVERCASAAPEDVQNEAAIRTIGYLVDQPAAAKHSERVGEFSQDFAASMVNALYYSGAAALLAPWREHRAGVIR